MSENDCGKGVFEAQKRATPTCTTGASALLIICYLPFFQEKRNTYRTRIYKTGTVHRLGLHSTRFLKQMLS